MASPATSSHLPALAEPHEREAIAHELQATMQELVDLSLIGQQLHWAVIGHAFRPVHEHLDELVESWRDLADAVAERAVALGYVPDGQARAVMAGSPLSPVAAEATESRAAVRAITDRIAQVSETARAHGPDRRARRGLAGRADRRRPRARAPAVDAARAAQRSRLTPAWSGRAAPRRPLRERPTWCAYGHARRSPRARFGLRRAARARAAKASTRECSERARFAARNRPRSPHDPPSPAPRPPSDVTATRSPRSAALGSLAATPS